MKLLTMLLKNNCCVKTLAHRLELTEANISQHLKMVRKVGLLVGEKCGYYMRYSVKRTVLRELIAELEALEAIKRETCTPEKSGCQSSGQENCYVKCGCSDQIKKICHG